MRKKIRTYFNFLLLLANAGCMMAMANTADAQGIEAIWYAIF